MAKIANKITELTGNDETINKAREQFTFLQKMAQAKCAEYEAKLKDMLSGNGREKCEVVGNRAINYYKSQHVDIKVGCDKAIEEAVNSFFKGKSGVKEGFQKLVTCALSTLIGNTAIGEYEDEMFFIYPENNAIVRVDVLAYKYTFTNSGIIGNCENVFCYAMSKSIVDHTKLTKDELLYFVTQMCRGGDEEGEEKVDLQQVMGFVKELIEIWNLLDQEIVKNEYVIDVNSGNLQMKYYDAQEPTAEQIANGYLTPDALTVEQLKEYMANH